MILVVQMVETLALISLEIQNNLRHNLKLLLDPRSTWSGK